MSSDEAAIKGVPTNIITGFLGVGKTSVILNLMKNKPSNERWAVLVNEFGEIGVDGSLFLGKQSTQQHVFIREVPGGCMCCAAGLPMQIALNQLLSEAKPDRLLIEPTGLGHPKEVLQVLSTDYYREILSLQKNITLVDARHLSDAKYTEHETFNQQIMIADTVIGHKCDLYCGDEAATLDAYVDKIGRPSTRVIFAQFGNVPIEEFEGATNVDAVLDHHHHHHLHGQDKPLVSELPMPESGMLKATNQGEGFQSVGWRFAANKVFNQSKLEAVFNHLDVERMKAVFITGNGIFGYNLTKDGLTKVELDECVESRIELIASEPDPLFESRLFECL